MSLNMIRDRVERGDYPDIAAFVKDVDLVFDNAMIYNVEGSEIFADAKILRDLLHAKIDAETKFKHVASSRIGMHSIWVTYTCRYA